MPEFQVLRILQYVSQLQSFAAVAVEPLCHEPSPLIGFKILLRLDLSPAIEHDAHLELEDLDGLGFKA